MRQMPRGHQLLYGWQQHHLIDVPGFECLAMHLEAIVRTGCPVQNAHYSDRLLAGRANRRPAVENGAARFNGPGPRQDE